MTSQLWPAWLVHGMHLMKEAEVPRALASLPSPRSSGFSARSCAALPCAAARRSLMMRRSAGRSLARHVTIVRFAPAMFAGALLTGSSGWSAA